MARKRTGLRNRFRSGRSTYGKRRKANGADLYGQPNNGTIEDIIAGHVLRYPVGVGQDKSRKMQIPAYAGD